MYPLLIGFTSNWLVVNSLPIIRHWLNRITHANSKVTQLMEYRKFSQHVYMIKVNHYMMGSYLHMYRSKSSACSHMNNAVHLTKQNAMEGRSSHKSTCRTWSKHIHSKPKVVHTKPIITIKTIVWLPFNTLEREFAKIKCKVRKG